MFRKSGGVLETWKIKAIVRKDWLDPLHTILFYGSMVFIFLLYGFVKLLLTSVGFAETYITIALIS